MPLFRKNGRNSERTIPQIPFLQCYAKTREGGSPGISVIEHSVRVAETAKALLGVLPEAIRDVFPEDVIAMAALHDIGKISPGFQLKYFSDAIRELYPEYSDIVSSGFCSNHTEIGSGAINHWTGEVLESAPAAEIAASHHGGKQGKTILTDTGSEYGGPSWSCERKKAIHHLTEKYGMPVNNSYNTSILAAMAGLVSVADWIGSDDELFHNQDDEGGSAEKAVEKCGWFYPEFYQKFSFKDIFGFGPYPLQSALADMADQPGLYVVEAPMGMGKTEAALYAAYRLLAAGKASGIYFALPTRLTSDRIHERMESFLKCISKTHPDAILAHGNAWLKAFMSGKTSNSEEGREDNSVWFHSRKRSLLYPFAAGTVDQALMSVLRVRHSFMRTFGLAGKVVILDEVHSYDLYTGTLINTLIRQLMDLNCTVIILSATLTAERRDKLMESYPNKMNRKGKSENNSYPLITECSSDKIRSVGQPGPPEKQVAVSLKPFTESEIAESAVEHAQRGECVLCIANTVATAQVWFNQIKSCMVQEAFPVGLLHSKFPGWRREELEKNWMDKLGKNGNRPQGCILVATQVVEQSVDIDADFMVTELAPTDMLLQRMGRLWRHDRIRDCKTAEVCIVANDLTAADSKESLIERIGKSNARVYAPYILWRSWKVWKERNHIALPRDMRDLLEHTYTELEDEPDFILELKQTLKERSKKLEQYAISVSSNGALPVLKDDENMVTRYSDYPMMDCVLAKNVDVRGRMAELDLSDNRKLKINSDDRNCYNAVHLHRNLISIPCFRIPQFEMPGCLRKYFYDKTPVLVICEDGELLLDNTPIGFRYDDNRGLCRNRETAVNQRKLSTDEEDDSFPYSDFDENKGFDW